MQVCWQYDYSPTESTIPTRPVNQLLQTPVRIVKRHMSSPVFNSYQNKKPSLDDLSQLKQQFQLNLDDSLDEQSKFSDEEFDDDQLLAAVDEIEKEAKPQSKDLTSVKAACSTIFEDSFDDAIFASIPLDVISKKCATNVDIVYNPQEGSSQIVSDKTIMPRHTSDPTNPSKNIKKDESRWNQGKQLQRHVSLPSTSRNSQAQSSSKPTNGSNKNLVPTKISPSQRLCTPAEIAEKKRQAMERRQKTLQQSKK